MKYIVANWKSHKNREEVLAWIKTFCGLVDTDYSLKQAVHDQKLKIIIAPPYPFLLDLYEASRVKHYMTVAAQSVSSFSPGSYTGDVAASSLKGLVEYVIVGHSERRTYHQEDSVVVRRQIDQLQNVHIKQIVCISEPDQYVENVHNIAYEPLGAIGTGDNTSVEQVVEFKKQCFLFDGTTAFLYGGSVTSLNTAQYLSSEHIDGVLVGAASLDPHEFYLICTQALKCV